MNQFEFFELPISKKLEHSTFGPMKQYKTYFPLEKSELTDSMECPPLDENSELKLFFNVGLS